MKHLLKLYFYMICVVSSYSQVKSGVATYKINANEMTKIDDANKKNGKLEKVLKLIANDIKNLTYVLEFDKNNAIYYGKDIMVVGGQKEALIRNLSKLEVGAGEYYTDLLNQKQLIIRNHSGKQYNVLESINKNKWRLTKEKKELLGFVCYKAILLSTNQKAKVEAWYCPKIPFAYGPKNYVGALPGLILELKTGNIRYYCEKITINPKKEVSVAWPKNIKTISKEDYKKAGGDAYKKLK